MPVEQSQRKGFSDTDIPLSNLLKYGRTLEATLTQVQAMIGNNNGTSPKQAMTVGEDASVYKTELHQHSTAPKRTISRNRVMRRKRPWRTG